MPVTTRHGSRTTILVVDDQRMVLQSLQRMLEAQGYATMGVTSGWGALQILQSETPIDLTLVDVVLGDVSGREVIERARRLRPGMPIVAMSGYGNQVEGVSDQPAADGYLSKPFETEELVHLIESRIATRDERERERGASDFPAPRDAESPEDPDEPPLS